MKQPRLRQALILLALVTCVVYLVYRGFFTLNFVTIGAVIASLFLYVAELFMGVLMLLFLLQVWRPEEPPEQPVLPDRTVDVYVPTYNEDVQILRTTLLACVKMDYPHKTYLLDDGGTDARVNDPEKGPAARKRQELLKAMCAELGVVYLTRPRNEHAKAGNMNHALKQTDGEFLIIFDADHVPDCNFITRLIGYFRDDKLAYVQTPHAFYNFDSFQSQYNPVRSTYWEEGQLFHDVIQTGRNRWNAAIFAGAAAMFRRRALPSTRSAASPRRRSPRTCTPVCGCMPAVGSRWPFRSASSPARQPRTSPPSTRSACAGARATSASSPTTTR
jgi:cellulose synthase/poly-beta-1,6-N-acetylglucosamine synthase-like glycosyltransferase